MDFNEFQSKINSVFQNTTAFLTNRSKNISMLTMAEKIAYPIVFCGCILAFFGLILFVLGI